MAHPAPVRRGTALPGTGRHRARPGADWTVPLLVGVAFGLYAWFLDRNQQFTTRATVVGLVSGVVAMLVAYLLNHARTRLIRELRAASYAAATGIGTGFLYSLSGKSVPASAGMGMILGAGVGMVLFYVFYTHED